MSSEIGLQNITLCFNYIQPTIENLITVFTSKDPTIFKKFSTYGTIVEILSNLKNCFLVVDEFKDMRGIFDNFEGWNQLGINAGVSSFRILYNFGQIATAATEKDYKSLGYAIG